MARLLLCWDMKWKHLCFINACGLAVRCHWLDTMSVGGKLEKHAESANPPTVQARRTHAELDRNHITTLRPAPTW